MAFVNRHRKIGRTAHSVWLNADFTTFWQPLHLPRPEFAPVPPALRQQMVETAAAIGRAFSFVRVDFLIGDDGRLYVSELTFSPGNGLTRLPEKLDREIGAMWTLDLVACRALRSA